LENSEVEPNVPAAVISVAVATRNVPGSHRRVPRVRHRNHEASMLARLAEVQEAAGDTAGAAAARARSTTIFEQLKVTGIDVVATR
jgi:hypothetical protein